MQRSFIPCIFIASVLNACASVRNPEVASVSSSQEDVANELVETNELVLTQPAELAAAEKKDSEEFRSELRFADHEQRAEVQKWLRFFTHEDKPRFTRFLQKGLVYKPLIETILQKEGVPTFFYYLALIESGFQLHARSHASAVGLWQFIRPTGTRYGLSIDRYLDERRDPVRSSLAAASYLKDLHNVFHSWFLAMSAYNSGEGRVMNSIMRHKSRDFWELVRLRALPPETRNYVPKFIAAAIIGAAPEKFGIKLHPVEPLAALQAVNVPSPVKLADIAKQLQMPLDTLKSYNPNILRGITPPMRKTYRVWVPRNNSLALNGLRKLPRVAGTASEVRANEGRTHLVRRGESLRSIARKYATSPSALKLANELRSNHLRTGMRLSIPEVAAKRFRKYEVKAGENLHMLAERSGNTVAEIKSLNHLKRSRIYAGQTLRLPLVK